MSVIVITFFYVPASSLFFQCHVLGCQNHNSVGIQILLYTHAVAAKAEGETMTSLT